VRPVIGTSGYAASDIEELRLACANSKIGCVFAPNFGIGAVLMMKFAAEAACHYRAVEIVEMHEAGKQDAPSGTAMATARRLAAAGSFERLPTRLFKAEGARGAEMNGIGIHSLRLPGVVAHQEVIFGGDGETLRIIHDSTSRGSFMGGVLRAVRAVKDLTEFVEGLESFL
jgi:4-hydroxy-tetrahydrodipicolinate reductase